jgi:mRNA interferase MazF
MKGFTGRLENGASVSSLRTWAANRNLARVVVVPMTSNTDRQYPGEALVTINGKPGKVMADQIMASDKRRLKNQLGALSKIDMQSVEDAILVHLGMPR